MKGSNVFKLLESWILPEKSSFSPLIVLKLSPRRIREASKTSVGSGSPQRGRVYGSNRVEPTVSNGPKAESDSYFALRAPRERHVTNACVSGRAATPFVVTPWNYRPQWVSGGAHGGALLFGSTADRVSRRRKARLELFKVTHSLFSVLFIISGDHVLWSSGRSGAQLPKYFYDLFNY